MKPKPPKDNALPSAICARLKALAEAAEGCDWESREVDELVSFYKTLDLPWHVPTYVGGIHELRRHEIGGRADVSRFIAGMHRLARCVDFGQPLSPDCLCAGCRRRQQWGAQFFTVEEQEAAERRHGSFACEYEPRFAEAR